jgi:putative ABC transport system substrate-binding protein
VLTGRDDGRLLHARITRRTSLQALVLAATGGFASASVAANAELRVITSDASEVTRQILQAITRRVRGAVSDSDARALAQRRGPGVYASLGPAALQAGLDANLGGPLLSLFTSNEVYTRLLAGAASTQRQQTGAIFAEASPQSQMELIRALYERKVAVAVLLSESTANQETIIRRAARANDLDIEVQLVNQGESAVRALTRLRSAAVLLTVPDRDLYTAESLRDILESTYRRGQAVIGFTPSLVTAGTLAAAYASIEDTVAYAAELVAAISNGQPPEPRYPHYWRVAVNDTVARSLNLVVAERVRGLGSPPPP